MLLAPHGIGITTPDDHNIPDPPDETGITFLANANIKAGHFSKHHKGPLIAEDSGLLVRALSGAPGVHTRRWCGEESADEELLEKLLRKLSGVTDRAAEFKVVVAFRPRSGITRFASGSLKGTILEEPRGEIIPGYPFRSVFYVPEIGQTLGELSMGNEALATHRRCALDKLLPYIYSALGMKDTEQRDF